MSYIYGEGESDTYGIYDEYGYDEPEEPVRCELDWQGGVCLSPLDPNGDCGRTIEHNQ